MRWFWRHFLLRGDLPPDLLEHLHFACFGLGDSTYPKFNWPAKKLDRRLVSLGATAFIERGEADDQDYAGSVSQFNCFKAELRQRQFQRRHDIGSMARSIMASLRDTLAPASSSRAHPRHTKASSEGIV